MDVEGTLGKGTLGNARRVCGVRSRCFSSPPGHSSGPPDGRSWRSLASPLRSCSGWPREDPELLAERMSSRYREGNHSGTRCLWPLCWCSSFCG